MDWLDRAAMTGSAACMIHCLVLPLLLAAVPALSAIVAIPESIHRWVLLFAVPTAMIALLGGHARHAAVLPLCLGVAGLVLMTLGAFVVAEGRSEVAMTVAGSISVAIAHIVNLRLRAAYTMLHAAKVGGLGYRLVMTLSGLALALLGSLSVWSFWFKRPARKPARTRRPTP